MAKPVKLPKYLQGKNPKPLIEVFEDYKPIDPLNLIKPTMQNQRIISIIMGVIEKSVRLKGENMANLAPNKIKKSPPITRNGKIC
jgi:hypothetical protein